jgi:hypothetical protein
MKIDDSSKFKDVMKYLSICFPEYPITKEIIESYFVTLFDYKLEKIQQAAQAYVKKGVRFPYVSDLVSHF